VQRDDDILEENHVLVTEGHGKARNDGSQDIKQLGGSVELMRFVNQAEEALVDRFSDHLSAGYQLKFKAN